MWNRRPDEPLPGQSANPPPVERPARDLEEVWAEGDRLRRLVEEKLKRAVEAGEKGVSGWAKKLESLRDSLERSLAELTVKEPPPEDGPPRK